MMNQLMHNLRLVQTHEYTLASQDHGKVFKNVHEGYGVIAEEVSEADDECKTVKAMMEYLAGCLRYDPDQMLYDTAEQLEDTALNAAAELVQVSAMCRKLKKTIRKELKEKMK